MWCAGVGRWAAAVSGWSKGRREDDTGRLNPNEGSFLQPESACMSPADGLLSVESWGVGAKSFPCAQGGPFFIPYFTSLSPLSLGLCYALFCLLLFCASLCISLLLTFSHTKQRFFSPFFFFAWRESFFSVWVVLCCLRNTLEGWLWQEKNAESSCSSLFGSCPSLRTECKDHHINHQPPKQAGKKTTGRHCSWLEQEPSSIFTIISLTYLTSSKTLQKYVTVCINIYKKVGERQCFFNYIENRLYCSYIEHSLLLTVNLKTLCVITVPYIFLRAL